MHAKGFSFLGHSDQGGRADGLQVMVGGGHAYVGHMFSQGFTVLDVRDPRRPTPVAYVAAPPGTWNLHLQLVGDVLVVVNEADLFAKAAFARESSYYGTSVGRVMADLPVDNARGLRVFDVSDTRTLREVGFMSVPGVGLHRVFWTGGRWAYASALLPGFTDFMLVTIDMADATRPALVGRWWLPGQNYGAGEAPAWDTGRWRYGLHHAVVAGDTAYAAWRDGGLTVLDVSDRAQPQLVVHKNWSPPYGGGTHSCLPLPGATYSWSPTNGSPTTPPTGSSGPGSSTSGCPRTRSRSPPSHCRARTTSWPRAATTDRTTCTRTGRDHS